MLQGLRKIVVFLHWISSLQHEDCVQWQRLREVRTERQMETEVDRQTDSVYQAQNGILSVTQVPRHLMPHQARALQSRNPEEALGPNDAVQPTFQKLVQTWGAIPRPQICVEGLTEEKFGLWALLCKPAVV